MKCARKPHLLRAGFLLLATSLFLGGLWFIQPSLVTHSQTLLYLAVGSFLFGIGEILNHPKQTADNYTDNSASDLRRVHHWSRNPCPLGNLLDIAGIIFLFIGFGRLISP